MTSRFSGLVSGLTQAGKQVSEQVQSQIERHRNPDGATTASGEQGGRPSSTSTTQGGAFANLKTTMRQGFVEYDPRQSSHTMKLQVAIRAQRGCVSDHENIGRDSQVFSKALVSWGEQQPELDEVKDESDRIAYLLYKSGEAHSAYANSLQQSRSALKDLRNFESKLNQRRDKRVELQKKIDQLTTAHAKQPKHGQEIESLQSELGQLKQEDAAEEAAVEAMKKQKLREGFNLQFEALQRLGEQLALIGAHGQALVNQPYDAARTGQIKSAAQTALDTWSPSRSFTPQVQLGAHGLERHDTTSFASTHSAELARIKLDDHSAAHSSYYDHPQSTNPLPVASSGQSTNYHPTSTSQVPMSSPPLPAGGSLPPINMQPTPLTHPASPPTGPAPLRDSSAEDHTSALSHVPSDPITTPAGPTVAETGVPLGGDPGPKSGQLPNRRTSTSAQSEAARRKQEEARQELRNNFENLQGGGQHAGPSSATGQQQEYLPAYEEPRLQ